MADDCRSHVAGMGDTKTIKEMDWKDLKENHQDALEGDTFKDGKPYYILSPNEHCREYADFVPAIHQMCQCKDSTGQPIPGCTPASYLYPFKTNICIDVDNPPGKSENLPLAGRACTKLGDSFYPLSAYCCCSCFAFGTKISVPDGIKNIEKFILGDEVLTADLKGGNSHIEPRWRTAEVSFSSGTGENSIQPAMVYVCHGEGGATIVTPNHLFLMPGGKMKRADRLVPGRDFLVSGEGESVPIQEVSIGEFRGGVHHIATDIEFAGGLDGHLLLSDGVISGDFDLQIHAAELEEKGLMENQDEMPKVGSNEYLKKNGEKLLQGSYRSYRHRAKEGSQKELETRPFYVYGEKASAVPIGAASYFTTPQASDIMENAPTYEFDEMAVCNAAANYTATLFGGFYKDYEICYDISRIEPNMYTFEERGRNVILMTGGLARIKGLTVEGMALMLSHMVARCQRMNPAGRGGYTSVGMADYYSAGIMRTVFFGDLFSGTFQKGEEQLEKLLFSKIKEENDSYHTDPYTPSTETRLEALDAGFAMTFPPADIGGPVYRGLEVKGAQVQPAKAGAETFLCEDIDRKQAEKALSDLLEKGIIDEEGILAEGITVYTDLTWLFAEEDENLGAYHRELVRSRLLHAAFRIQVQFSLPMGKDMVRGVNNYKLSPSSRVIRAWLDEDDKYAVWLEAELVQNTEYTLTVSRVTSENGSTISPAKCSARFTAGGADK